MTCVHCEKPIGTGWMFRYSMSLAMAHLRCVSVVSAPGMDALLYALLS